MASKHLGGDWLSTDQAAKLLGIHRNTLYKRIDEGAIDAYKMGRVIRVRREDVELLLRRAKDRSDLLRNPRRAAVAGR